jgi:HSP20 family protein
MLWTDLSRWGRGFDPWSNLDWLADEVNRSFSAARSNRASEFPLVNIWANADGAMLTTEIPGIDPKSIEISVAGKTVSLRGSRISEPGEEGTTYHRRERWQGQFSKTMEMPFNVEADQVEARFSKGILRITLPKAHADRPRTIQVKAE